MTLSKYNQKRDFEQTQEPEGKIGKSDNELKFVVQKHAASHLHYDFRLELDGVLLSWAVPKGPSMDPEIKRLAMMVEDHPYSYKDFEGTIPEGNYGAGNVIVWDNGTYAPAEDLSQTEKTLKDHLAKGRLSFVLKGKKLKGEFSLVKLEGKQENAWLLIKKNDKYASDADILLKNKSVISKSTLEDLEKKSKSKTYRTTKDKKAPEVAETIPERAIFLKPMLANSIEKPFDNPDWIFENKYDGYRILAVINSDDVQLWSRNHISFNTHFNAVIPDLKKIQHTVVLDGEVVVEDDNGKESFQMLQNYIKTGKGNLKYYAFDILNLDGNSTLNLNLLARKELLKILLNKQQLSNVYYSEHTVGNGIKEFDKALKNKSEGLIAKKADSHYLINKRSPDWLKIKVVHQEEAIIIGLTAPKNSRKNFGALLLGQYNGKKMQFIGKCGTGFNDKILEELYESLLPYFSDEPAVSENLGLRDTIQWVKPKLVCQVKYAEWTNDMHLRHPVYLGLRVDKKAADVQMSAQGIPTAPKVDKNNQETEGTKETNTGNDFDLKIGKTTLHLTNQNKIYFPADSISKGDVVQYYNEVADLILPYLKNRPQSMNRFPNGITSPGFYQKDVDVDKIPSWLQTEKVYSESNDKYLDYLICNNKQTLLYMANLGCIDINPWNSTIKNIENPDWLVIDIDPENDNFQEVIQTALTVKEVMDELESDCYCKTSGATGLHVYIPLGSKYNYEQVKILAELLAIEIQQRLPEITSLERSIKKRNHKIYVDYLQNRRGQTLAAPYSVRPVAGATVSTPLEWNEVNAKLHPSQFHIKNALARFEKKGDLWSPVLGKGADIKNILKKLESRKKD